MSSEFDVVVIGSGLGGLTAGALFAHSGARVLVLERNPSFGGAATTYHRGPLTIEASLHETPLAPGDPKRELFEILGLAEEIDLVQVPNLHEVRWQGLGEPFQLPHGFENVEAALVDRFPDERAQIHALLAQIRRTIRLGEFISPERGGWWRTLHAAELPLDLWAALRDIRSSLSEVLERYFGDNEALKFALCSNLPYFADDPDNYWWLAFTIGQGSYMQGGGYYIRGGSQRLSDRLVEIVRDAGGTALTNSPAVGISLGQDGGVSGVRYRDGADGSEVSVATRVVFANAAPHVVAEMLPSTERTSFVAPFEGRPLSISLVSATLGLDKPPASFGISSYSTVLIPSWMERFSDFKYGTLLFNDDPAGRLPVMCVVDYGQIDSGLVQDGYHPLNIACADRLENWEGLDDTAYRTRRDAWLADFVKRLDKEWPGLAVAVKASTMSTARSIHRHLNTPGGAVYGFAKVPPTKMPRQPAQTTATPVEGLWISSAYTGFGGGFSGAIGAGIAAARAAMRSIPGSISGARTF